MADSNPVNHHVVRCPECELGMLTTPGFTVRTDVAKRFKLPVKVCRRCKILILHEKTWSNGWKVWNKKEYVTRPD